MQRKTTRLLAFLACLLACLLGTGQRAQAQTEAVDTVKIRVVNILNGLDWDGCSIQGWLIDGGAELPQNGWQEFPVQRGKGVTFSFEMHKVNTIETISVVDADGTAKSVGHEDPVVDAETGKRTSTYYFFMPDSEGPNGEGNVSLTLKVRPKTYVAVRDWVGESYVALYNNFTSYYDEEKDDFVPDSLPVNDRGVFYFGEHLTLRTIPDEHHYIDKDDGDYLYIAWRGADGNIVQGYTQDGLKIGNIIDYNMLSASYLADYYNFDLETDTVWVGATFHANKYKAQVQLYPSEKDDVGIESYSLTYEGQTDTTGLTMTNTTNTDYESYSVSDVEYDSKARLVVTLKRNSENYYETDYVLVPVEAEGKPVIAAEPIGEWQYDPTRTDYPWTRSYSFSLGYDDQTYRISPLTLLYAVSTRTNIEKGGTVELIGDALIHDDETGALTAAYNAPYAATVIPNDGYVCDSLDVRFANGDRIAYLPDGENLNFTITQGKGDAVVTAYFSKQLYAVSYEEEDEIVQSVLFEGESLNEDNYAAWGDSVTAVVTMTKEAYAVYDLDFSLADAQDNDVSFETTDWEETTSQGDDMPVYIKKIKFEMPTSDVALNITPSNKEYPVTVDITGQGQVVLTAGDSVVSGNVACRTSVIATATAETGYKVETLEVNAETFDREENSVSFVMPAAATTVTAVFVADTFTVSYVVMEETVRTERVAFGDVVPEPDYDVPYGLRFGGWQGVPETMPAQDLTLVGLLEGDFTYVADSTEATYEGDGWAGLAAALNHGTLPEEVAQILLNSDISYLPTQIDIDTLTLSGARGSSEVEQVPTIGGFTGSIDGQGAVIENMTYVGGSLIDTVATGSSFSGMTFENATAIADLRACDYYYNDDTIFVSVLAKVNNGDIHGFGFAGRVVVDYSQIPENLFEGREVVVCLVGENMPGASLSGFLYDMSEVPADSVGNRQCISIKQNLGIGRNMGDAKVATNSSSGKKSVGAGIDFSSARFQAREVAFTDEEFKSGLVAAWLNYAGDGFTGRFTGEWSQGLRYPILAVTLDGASNAVYRIAYTSNNEALITSAPDFACGGKTVTIATAELPENVSLTNATLISSTASQTVVRLDGTGEPVIGLTFNKSANVETSLDGESLRAEGSLSVVGGKVSATGTPARVFTLGGRLVGEVRGGSLTIGTPGLYVVRQGKRAMTFVVK